MTESESAWPLRLSVVLGDANVLYSRVLRDYLLYAMTDQLMRVRWSEAILNEVVEHLIKNVQGFDSEAGQRLTAAMNGTFPASQVDVSPAAMAAVAAFRLPDEDDRHVLAAAVAAEADFLCTDNIGDFPGEVLDGLGIRVLTSDELLAALIQDHSERMVQVHRIVVSRLRHATDESTIFALRRAQAHRAADLLSALIARE